MRDEHMKDKYLEVKKYPKATLTLTKLELPANVDASKGDFSAKAVSFEGKMNFHGVERPVKGTADIAAKGGSANVNAQFEMKCGEYAINQPSFAGITMADGVQVNVNGVAKILPN
jgi:polyisoprenoid-binding protein YceI